MAAKKKAKKAAKKRSVAKKASAKKAATKKTAAKNASAKKAARNKAAAKKPKKAASKKAAAKKPKKAASKKAAVKKKAPAKPAPVPKAKSPSKPASPASTPEGVAVVEGTESTAGAPAAKEQTGGRGGPISATSVNLGHVFALRPRVHTSFKPDDLRAAKASLDGEGYPTIEEAARAVATKALELSQQQRPQKNRKQRKRH